MKPRRRLGIMGGTFDPVHFGHLVTAERARGEFELDAVWFLPSGNPPHKDPRRVTDPHHRFVMTQVATLSNPHFEVSRMDIEREGVSYTIDTLRSLKKLYGDETQLFFITGADAILEIMGWKDPEEILTLADFIAATRPGFSLSHAQPEIREWFLKQGRSPHVLQVPAMAISSTDIRERVGKNQSIRYMVPSEVEYYIHKYGLYVS